MEPPSPVAPSPEASPEDDDGLKADDLPMTMAASVVLEHLPRDASKALETAGDLEQEKVTIRLAPLPNTPQLRQPRFKCSTHQRFEYIVRFLRRKLALKDHQSVFCYVNSVFSPGLDEGVGNLWRVINAYQPNITFVSDHATQCFKTGDDLVVSYSITPAFG